MNTKTAWPRAALILTSLAAFTVTMIYGKPVTDSNPESLRILVTIFSILSGMIIAIITLTGDAKFLYMDNWRTANIHRRMIIRRLNRYKFIFHIYFAVLTLAFLVAFLGRIDSEEIAQFCKSCERLTLSIGAGALVLSFGLPSIIVDAHKERLDDEVERLKDPSA
ncbi:MAG: hypothetical protein F4X12_13060 [Acidobacteriia bacterium]|nr:hypothetical protein [Terriglobia bacterium]